MQAMIDKSERNTADRLRQFSARFYHDERGFTAVEFAMVGQGELDGGGGGLVTLDDHAHVVEGAAGPEYGLQ